MMAFIIGLTTGMACCRLLHVQVHSRGLSYDRSAALLLLFPTSSQYVQTQSLMYCSQPAQAATHSIIAVFGASACITGIHYHAFLTPYNVVSDAIHTSSLPGIGTAVVSHKRRRLRVGAQPSNLCVMLLMALNCLPRTPIAAETCTVRLKC